MTIDTIREQVIRDLARGTSDLPALPRGVGEALKLARQSDFELDQATKLAESDPPIAARLLATANSALYSRGEAISSVRRAVVRLGVQAVRDVLYQAAYSSMLIRVPRFQAVVEESFHHGVTTARIARRIAASHGLDADTAFLAALLHDLGRARIWKLLASRGPSSGVPDSDLALIVEELHPKAGADLAAAWQLPSEVVDSCLYHREPGNRLYPRVVAVANWLARVCEGRITEDESREKLAAIGFPMQDFDAHLAFARKEYEASSDLAPSDP